MIHFAEIAALVAATALYLIPSIEADAHAHPDAVAIMLVNILLGWTVVGWFAARAWARRPQQTMPYPRMARRIRNASAHMTVQKIVDHAHLRAALAYRNDVRRERM